MAHRVGAVVVLEGIVDHAHRQRTDTLRRGALLRCKRMAGPSSVEFGLVASLGRRPPMSVVRLAAAVGMDKGTDQSGAGRTGFAQAGGEGGQPPG
jgi:hypothetical protein